MSMINEAMVLAAGLGARMRPLTHATPKPLIEVRGKALIDYTLDRFVASGVERCVVNVHYLADQLEAHVAARETPSLTISDEREALLETGGGLKKARRHFSGETIFCANTDAILCDGPGLEACARLRAAWNSDQMDMLLLLCPIDKTSGYDGLGDFHLDTDGHAAFRNSASAPFVFTGLQLLKPSLFDDGPDGPFSTKILWDKACRQGRLRGVVHDGFWLHVGDPGGLEKAEGYLSKGAS